MKPFLASLRFRLRQVFFGERPGLVRGIERPGLTQDPSGGLGDQGLELLYQVVGAP
jgi:hypothetical protein